jgi:hypothetical protein
MSNIPSAFSSRIKKNVYMPVGKVSLKIENEEKVKSGYWPT